MQNIVEYVTRIKKSVSPKGALCNVPHANGSVTFWLFLSVFWALGSHYPIEQVFGDCQLPSSEDAKVIEELCSMF